MAHPVWERFGDVPNYVEPFAGSLAVLLARPHDARVETVNDRDCYLANFWRALQVNPVEVAAWADWPVNEADLHARHRWLVEQADFRERMLTDPAFFDPKIAGWWVWGISQWIGSGWCSQPEWQGRSGFGAPRGIHRGTATSKHRSRPNLEGNGVHRKRPNLGGLNNKGVHRASLSWQVPDISGDGGAAGRGVHASALARKLPKMDRGTDSRLATRRAALIAWFDALAGRLRNVRVCCGDWTRILGPSPTVHIGVTGVFLDPPYDPAAIAAGAGKASPAPTEAVYAHHDPQVSAAVREWALAHGADPRLRIAVCGYEGEHDVLSTAGWSVYAWTAQGGYAARAEGKGKRNRERERIWFSPHCLRPVHEGPLFAWQVEP